MPQRGLVTRQVAYDVVGPDGEVLTFDTMEEAAQQVTEHGGAIRPTLGRRRGG